MALNADSLSSIAITTAVSNTVVDIGVIPEGTMHITAHSNFTYGSGGTSAKFYLQTSCDGGTTWYDIVSFAHATTSSRRICNIVGLDTKALTTATDGALTDSTKLDGLLGDRLRLKYTTVGTYAGSTSYKLDLIYR